MNSSAKWIVFLVCVTLILALGYFVVMSFIHANDLPPGVKDNADYPIAIADAMHLRFVEAAVSAVLFLVFAWVLGEVAAGGPVWLRLSWLRNFLSLLIGMAFGFVIFSKLMEERFHEKFPSAPLPIEAVWTALEWALAGSVVAFTVFFLSGMIHVMRVGHHARG